MFHLYHKYKDQCPDPPLIAGEHLHASQNNKTLLVYLHVSHSWLGRINRVNRSDRSFHGCLVDPYVGKLRVLEALRPSTMV